MEIDKDKTVAIRSYKIKLYPNKQQKESLNFIWDACRTLYNAALEQKLWATRTGKIPTLLEIVEWNELRIIAKNEGDEWEHPLGDMPPFIPKDEKGKAKPVVKLSNYDQCKYIPELSKALGWHGYVSSQMLQEVVNQDLKRDYNVYFANLRRWQKSKNGNMPKPPQFKSVCSPVSIGSQGHGGVKYLGNNAIRILGVGRVKARCKTAVPSGLEEHFNKHCRLIKDISDQWWLVAEYKNVPLSKLVNVDKVEGTVAVDLGIENLIVTSDGLQVQNLQPLERVLDKLVSIDKQTNQLVKAYFKIHNIRYNKTNLKKHYHAAVDSRKGRALSKQRRKLFAKANRTRTTMIQQAVAKLVYNYEYIIVEDLPLLQNSGGELGRKIRDAGLGKFYRFLQQKADEIGNTLIFIPHREMPTDCPACGYNDEEELVIASASIICCPNCGYSQDATVSNAQQLLELGKQHMQTNNFRQSRNPISEAAD